MTKEEARQKVAELVAKYQILPASEKKTHNEEKTKLGYILPLFAALGWNIHEPHEVAPEEAASGQRVDFAFKLNNVAQFYVEAKPLKADLNDLGYIKQAITYAYNNGVTWAVLTNFSSLRVFNAQTKDDQGFINLNCQDYVNDFDDLWLLSKEGALANALTEKAQKYGKYPPFIPIQERLFKQLRLWREELFNQLYHYNDWLKSEQRDEVIERLFNRLIFIRTAEDRKLEERRLLAAVHQWEKGGHTKDELANALHKIFTDYDGYYDSELFQPHLLDNDKLEIDQYIIAAIIKGLYEIPGGLADYDFSIIDADVLGRVYEQYLGYIAKVEVAKAKEAQAKMNLGIADVDYKLVEKKQHRKDQGIYYTPKFVTDYIVKETIGRFIKEHNGNDILNMKILDPACGSGSFLIRAYDELLDYHADQKGKPTAKLDQYERLPVLTRNIFGVDLDQQAVEIARLNLLLRALAKREILPPLTDNIKRGNSLISGKDEELKGCFGKKWKDKDPFDWNVEFKDIMAHGGFDVVIGNPPYVRIQSLPRDEADYFRSHFEAAFGSFDLYVLFIEQAIKLLKPGGRLGFITSGKFLKSDYGKKIRELIHSQCTVEDIIDLSAQQVFAEATTYPVIIILRKGAEKKSLRYVFVPVDSANSPDIASMVPIETTQGAIVKGVWPPIAITDKLTAKLTQKSKTLSEIAERIFVGLQTSADQVYILLKRGETADGKIMVHSRSLNADVELENTLLKPLLSGKDVERFGTPTPEQLLLFPYILLDCKAELILSEKFAADYPLCWQYLSDNRSILENRENGKMKHDKWYAFIYPKNLALHDQKKLAIPRLVSRLACIYDRKAEYYLDNVDVGGLILKEPNDANYLYVTSLLNSKLLDYYFQRISVPFRGGFRSANRQYLEPLPIHQIDFSNPAEKSMHDKLVALVENMLELNKKLTPIRKEFSNERDKLVKEIEKTDREIDDLVYQLYDLTEAERTVVEAVTGI